MNRSSILQKIMPFLIAIVFVFVYVLPVCANEQYICTSHVTLASNTEADRVKAAAIVSLSGYTWSYNYFHNQVERDIWNNNSGFMKRELTIRYKDDKNELTGEIGFADLAMEINDDFSADDGITYIWEVKPVHYGLNPVLEKKTFDDQLNRYIASDPNYKNGSTRIVNNSKYLIPSRTFISKEGRYTVTYEDAGNGLILYRYDLIDKEEKDDANEQSEGNSILENDTNYDESLEELTK